ncbi:hypothetical protein CEXT_281391 [Caerostris extrusa]|uniref:Uncharacterized protein n=1 Tax=Caerostris extrusa TaxID=172846 RepID=A0AAV4Y210_CAEEX|nr:hypothetical protein CEXT_281391 [Caerostris extrusa]
MSYSTPARQSSNEMEKAPIYIFLRSSERKCEGLFRKVQYLNRLLNIELIFFFFSYGFPTLLFQIDARRVSHILSIFFPFDPATFPDFFRKKTANFLWKNEIKENSGHYNRSWGIFRGGKWNIKNVIFDLKMPVQPVTRA